MNKIYGLNCYFKWWIRKKKYIEVLVWKVLIMSFEIGVGYYRCKSPTTASDDRNTLCTVHNNTYETSNASLQTLESYIKRVFRSCMNHAPHELPGVRVGWAALGSDPFHQTGLWRFHIHTEIQLAKGPSSEERCSWIVLLTIERRKNPPNWQAYTVCMSHTCRPASRPKSLDTQNLSLGRSNAPLVTNTITFWAFNIQKTRDAGKKSPF